MSIVSLVRRKFTELNLVLSGQSQWIELHRLFAELFGGLTKLSSGVFANQKIGWATMSTGTSNMNHLLVKIMSITKTNRRLTTGGTLSSYVVLINRIVGAYIQGEMKFSCGLVIGEPMVVSRQDIVTLLSIMVLGDVEVIKSEPVTTLSSSTSCEADPLPIVTPKAKLGSYVCPVCERIYYLRSSLTRHTIEHQPGNQ